MCGIAGAFYFDDAQTIEPEILEHMSGEIAHRGPDAQGFFTRPGVALVHRRLSIIDLAGGDQPLGNEDDSIQIVFNGEIYNYEELRTELIAKGHRFRTKSDTEVIVHLYEEMGEKLVECLRGMFAFAIYDANKQALLLARDRLGIKPLYIYRDQQKVVFASEIKSILAHPEVPRALDVCALEDYLAYGVVLGPRSIFQNIQKLPPAHTLIVNRSQSKPARRYWELTFQPDHTKSVEDWQEAIEAKLQESVKLHLISDVPVGAFLSGGIDSSAIVAMASRCAQEIQTFSIGFEDQNWSELPFARITAQKFGTRHTEQIVTPDAVSLLEELTRYYDEPFADSSALPTFLVSKLASEHVKVVLSGDGGDECFGGYARYAHDLKEAKIRRLIPNWLRRGIIGPMSKLMPKVDWLPRPLRLKSALTNLSLDEASAYARTIAICRAPYRRQLLSGDVVAQLSKHDPGAQIRDWIYRAGSSHPLDGMLKADIHSLLPDDFLVKVDRASMANGLEVRPPLLDHELMELAARIPAEHKVHKGETKWIFKQTARRLLPAEILDRRKQGFEIPIDNWLRGPLSEMLQETVLRTTSPMSALFNRPMVEKMIQQHTSGRGRHGGTLWSLLILARWADRYLAASSPLHPLKIG